MARTARLRGYQVFPSELSTGPVDLVIGINGVYHPFDVKQDCWYPEAGVWGAKNAWSVSDGVWAICVNPETGRVRWPAKGGRSKVPNCPPGWENIWD